jgi:uncharacterized membrane protein
VPLRRLPARLFLLLMLAGAALITASSLAYFDPEEVPPFVVERLPEHLASLWLGALRVHVAAALLSFPLCLLLTTRALQRRAALHRGLGRVTGAVVLFALVPSGVVLAFHAKGGAVVSAGFLLSAAIVARALVGGVAAARRGDLAAHAYAMRHVVGQMSVAVVSRAMLLAFDAASVDPDLAYVVALWVPVLGSVVVVELLSARGARLGPWFASFIERIRRELTPQDRLVRARAVARPLARRGR